MRTSRVAVTRRVRTPNRAARRASLQRAALEALESRHLLSVDLSGTFLTSPAAALGGTNQAVTVNVANTGDSRASGSMTVAYYAAPDGVTFDPDTALLLKSSKRSISIAPGASLNINDTLPLSVALPAGSYRLYAVIDSAHKITESNESNNTAQSGLLAIAQPNYDLIPAFAAGTALPPSILLAQKTSATVRVVIANSSGASVKLPSSLHVLVQVVARPDGVNNDSEDVLLNRSVVNAGTGALAPGASRTFSVGIQFPATLPAGDYDIVAKIDTGDALAETNESNNETQLPDEVKVAAPFADPELTFDAANVLPEAVAADGRTMPVKIDITNLGNTKIPGGQTCSIALSAHNIGDDSETPMQTFTVSLTNLAAGKEKTFSFKPTVPPGLDDGTYDIQATITTTVAGDDGLNNESFTDTFIVAPAFYNLSTLAPTSTFNPSLIHHTAVSGTINIPVRNLSNTSLPPGTLATMTVYLRPAGEVSDADDVLIGTASNVSLSSMAMGATKTFHVTAKIPASLPGGAIPDGDYVFVAVVAPDTLPESDSSDNTNTGGAVTLGPPILDLAVISATQNYHTPSAANSPGIGVVVLRNTGNVPVQGNITIQFYGTPEESAASSLLGSRTFQIALAPGASTPPLSTALVMTIPANGLLATAVDVVARIDPASFADANLANSQLAAGTVVVSSQYVDLMFANATNPFSGTLSAGATGSAHALVVNIGSGTAAGNVTVNYYATTTGSLDGSEILLGSETVNVSLGAAILSPTFNVPLTLPSPGTQTTYKIVAQLVAGLTIDNNPSDNVTPILGTVKVNP